MDTTQIYYHLYLKNQEQFLGCNQTEDLSLLTMTLHLVIFFQEHSLKNASVDLTSMKLRDLTQDNPIWKKVTRLFFWSLQLRSLYIGFFMFLFFSRFAVHFAYQNVNSYFGRMGRKKKLVLIFLDFGYFSFFSIRTHSRGLSSKVRKLKISRRV